MRSFRRASMIRFYRTLADILNRAQTKADGRVFVGAVFDRKIPAGRC